MKKIISIVLICTLIMALFASCGKPAINTGVTMETLKTTFTSSIDDLNFVQTKTDTGYNYKANKDKGVIFDFDVSTDAKDNVLSISVNMSNVNIEDMMNPDSIKLILNSLYLNDVGDLTYYQITIVDSIFITLDFLSILEINKTNYNDESIQIDAYISAVCTEITTFYGSDAPIEHNNWKIQQAVDEENKTITLTANYMQ